MTAAFDLADAAAMLRVLSHPARLRIALFLLEGEQGVGRIEATVSIRQPVLSQHLAELREAGLIAARREARNVFYSLANAHAVAVLAALHGPSSLPRRAVTLRQTPLPPTPTPVSTFAVVLR